MSSPGSEPAHGPHVEQTSLPQVALFSHPPKAEVLKQHHPLPADHVDWRAAPFSPTLPNQFQTLPPAPPDVHLELPVPQESRQT